MKKYYLHRESAGFTVDYEKELNPEQHAAVMHGDGPALVLAGAGTGKTRVVTYRVARLIESGVRAENILLLTFTNKAAKEMMRRVETLIGRNIRGLSGGTFHHAANLILRQHHDLAGYRKGFSILDREDSKDLFEACLPDVKKKDSALPRGSVLIEINSLSKNTGTPVDAVVIDRFPHFINAIDAICNVISVYEQKKTVLNLMDFDDLLLCWKKIIEEHAEVREYYSSKYRHVLVDEYQDTNRLQSEIIQLTTGEQRNLMVVGDDAQSIYSFRGADFDNILGFPGHFPGTAVYKLTTNYRSTPEILSLANAVIDHNVRQFRKELRSVKQAGELPYVVPLKDSIEQAEFVASVILDMNVDGRAFDSMAVLYRSHYQSMELQMELQRRGIPFEVRSGLKFFEQAHIKDILSFLRIIGNPRDEISWKRVLKLIQGIGNATASKIWGLLESADNPLTAVSDAARLVPKKASAGFSHFLVVLHEITSSPAEASPSATIDFILRNLYAEYLHSAYPNAEVRIEDIEQMIRFSVRYDSLEVFLSDLALQGVTEAEAEAEEAPDGVVVLSSVHQAKGLEWDILFIIGLTDGRFPSAKSLKSDDEEEERRLFYVGVTRAKESLYLCYPVTADDWSAIGFPRPSRFLKELPKDCFEEIDVENV